MLGLLAHGLHLLLLVLGLVGVGALVLPQLHQTRLSRGPSYRRPATVAEHDERVAALRASLATGQLTAPPLLESTTPRERVLHDPSLWRVMAVSSSGAAAFVHAALFPHHLQEGLLLGAFFLASAVVQAGWAYRVAREATSDLLAAGIIVNLALIALWAVTRTVGLPFGLLPGPEEVGGWDVSCVIWESTVVLACVAGLRTSTRQRRLVLGHLGRWAWWWMALCGIALIVLSLTVAHE